MLPPMPFSTEDFKAGVEKGMGGSMDWFFNEWVYGTEMPSYRFDYQLSDGGTTLSGKVTQSGVSDSFKMLVPVYADFGKGWVKVAAAWMKGNTSIDLTGVKLTQPQTAPLSAQLTVFTRPGFRIRRSPPHQY